MSLKAYRDGLLAAETRLPSTHPIPDSALTVDQLPCSRSTVS